MRLLGPALPLVLLLSGCGRNAVHTANDDAFFLVVGQLRRDLVSCACVPPAVWKEARWAVSFTASRFGTSNIVLESRQPVPERVRCMEEALHTARWPAAFVTRSFGMTVRLDPCMVE